MAKERYRPLRRRRAGPDPTDEARRLDLQALAWAPKTAALLDRIGVARGWRCLDLGCGPRGILDLLSRLAGPGKVVAGERNPFYLLAAQLTAALEEWPAVRFRELDATASRLRGGTFDLVHARFIGQEAGSRAVLREMVRLTKPGGVVVMQEPGRRGWEIDPSPPDYRRVEPLVRALFLGRTEARGASLVGEFAAAGLIAIRSREVRLTVSGGTPYALTPLDAFRTVAARLVAAGHLDRREVATVTEQLREAGTNPATRHRSFSVSQVWGVRPDR